MMNPDDLKKQLNAMVVAHTIDLRHALYLRRRNPIHVWRAYAAARQLGVPVPDWVLDYFDTCAKALATRHSSAKAIADALGLGTRGGRLVTGQADTDERNVAIVERIDQLQSRPSRRELQALADAHGLKTDVVDPGDRTLLVILEQVAAEYHLDVNQVQAIYYKMIRPLERPATPL
jgi:hypothetical protein